MVNPIETKGGSSHVVAPDGDQCGVGQRCVTCRVHELHTLGPCMGRVLQCFELVVHVDDVTVFGKVAEKA